MEIYRRSLAVFAKLRRFSFRSLPPVKSLKIVDLNPLSEGQNDDTLDDASVAHSVLCIREYSFR